MPILSWMTSFFRNRFGKPRNDQELNDEVHSYIELLAEEKMREGMEPEEARREARMELGGMEQVKESVREARRGAWFASLLQDVHYGVRMLRKNPGFTAIAVLTLALGIGANTAIFTLTDAALLRPLPYRAPEQLVWMTEQSSSGDSTGISWLNFQDWDRLNTVFAEFAGYRDIRMAFAGEGYPALIQGRYVTANYFNLMGVRPLLGRTFEPGENVEGGPEVAILSYEFWERQFGGSPQILGKTIRLNGRPFTLVGVMPKGFGGITRTELWAPFEQNLPKEYVSARQYSWLLYAIARLKPGVSFSQARSEMDRVENNLVRQYPEIGNDSHPNLKPLHRYMLGDNRAVLILLATAVGLLLLITCANLSGLLLVRISARQKELSLRHALGASKGRVLQQVFTEGVLLALTGGLTGILIAWVGLRFAAALLPASIPLAGPLHIDGHALLFTFAATALSSLVFGLIPAQSALRTDLQTVLKSSSYHVRGGHRRLHAAMIVCEMGLAMAVLVGTGLLVRTMIVLLQTKVGFESSQLLTATVTLSPIDFPSSSQTSQFTDQAIHRIEQLPGVESAAAVFPVPFTPQIFEVWLAVEGHIPNPAVEQTTFVSVVSPGYLKTMKIPILEGRGFTEQDSVPDSNFVLIDRQLASQYWPGQSPIGRSIKMATQDFSDPKQNPLKIIGVVAPVQAENLDAAPQPRIYILFNRQIASTMSFVVRTKTDPLNVAHDIQDEIHTLNRNVAVFNVGPMNDAIRLSQSSRQLAMKLLLSFSLAALVLATMGLYGVMSYLVGQRTSEIGIRMALGAQPREVLELILMYGARLVLGGAAVGLVTALVLGQVMQSLLYRVKPSDPLTFASAVAIIAVTALFACYIPARRAMRVDPMVALRHE